MQKIKFDGMSLEERAKVVFKLGLYLTSAASSRRRVDFYTIQNSIIVVVVNEQRTVTEIECPPYDQLSDYLEDIKVVL